MRCIFGGPISMLAGIIIYIMAMIIYNLEIHVAIRSYIVFPII